jgi:hypothetical protein
MRVFVCGGRFDRWVEDICFAALLWFVLFQGVTMMMSFQTPNTKHNRSHYALLEGVPNVQSYRVNNGINSQ